MVAMGPLRFLTNRLRNRQAKAHLAAATAQWQAGDKEGAIASCRAAVARCPDRAWYHDSLGHVLSHHHDYWLNPELTQQLLRTGQLDEAITSWRRALALGWTSHYTQLGLGHAFTAKGDIASATSHLRTATDLHIAATRPAHTAQFGNQGNVLGPDFLIIGGTKCGTTSLYEYLCGHPRVLPAVWKEIEYYRFPERGDAWYLAHFPRIPPSGPRLLTGEASTCYFAMSEVKDRVRAQYPNVRLIALVRDPVSKAISHCYHDRKLGCESRSPEQALARELDLLEAMPEPWRDATEYWRTERGYVWLGMYARFLEDWLTVFPREQLLILPSDELYSDPAATLAKVHAHLGLPDHREAAYPVHLQGRYEKNRSPLQDRLARFFAPHNQRLEELLGQRLPWLGP